MSDAMQITAIAPWFGSKRTLAPRIVAELGPHRAYWEPFCGSLAVLLAKEPACMETVNDLHGELINLARVLADEASAVALYGHLSRMLAHEDLMHAAAERWKQRGHGAAPDVPCVDSAVDFMLTSWLGRNGVVGTESYNQGFCVRYTQSGGHGATRWLAAVDSIPAWHRRLRGVTILHRDALEILERVEDAAGCAIYCDPPYLAKGAKYVHDFAPDDHARLASVLSRFRRTRVVVSYYADRRLDELYPGWTVVDCAMTKAMVNQFHRDRGGKRVAPEVLLINGPSHTARGQKGLW